ncbi:SAM-dependent methyltransferase [Okibacterium sp. HSC-33S16]|uniref:class I SAM-dependent methyltransferase n=1 Tax=Okibacterium sp. HSC-33S16 TaxID=2910965 RepID=UPI00209FAC11|nr:class I SAM-dependent methyltransferase [Okibacterium sp. HSC-33S16]MCP2030136.1 SAM-dependent methyltransferase [Okibacterium sp. HSC-33S16]
MTTPDPAHFEHHAALYDDARPPYPEELWQRLRDLSLLIPGGHALDLGAGSGQATGRLLAEGMHGTAVEPGVELGRHLHERFPQVSLLAATAEQVAIPDATFDIAVAATSIHWMDLSIVLPKISRALRPGGHLLVWRHIFGDPLSEATPFRQHIADIVSQRHAPPRPGPADVDTTGWATALVSGNFFTETHREEFRWAIRLDPAAVTKLFTTFSDWSADEVRQAAQAVKDEGGSVVEHYLTALIVLERL